MLGKQIVSLARLDCLRGAKESGIGVFPDCFRSGVGAKGEGGDAAAAPPQQGDGEATRWPSTARRPGAMLALSFAFGGHEGSNLAPIASLSHRDVPASYDSFTP